MRRHKMRTREKLTEQELKDIYVRPSPSYERFEIFHYRVLLVFIVSSPNVDLTAYRLPEEGFSCPCSRFGSGRVLLAVCVHRSIFGR